MSAIAKVKDTSKESGFFPELFRFRLYKPNQGRVVRQVTFVALAVLVALISWELYAGGWFNFLTTRTTTDSGRTVYGPPYAKYAAGLLTAALGFWISYRVVNFPKFTDFLISVEAEMNKVSWPTRRQLYQATVVVIFVIFAMAISLFLFDVLWTLVFETIGIRYTDENSMSSRIFQFFGF